MDYLQFMRIIYKWMNAGDFTIREASEIYEFCTNGVLLKEFMAETLFT